MSNEAGNGLFVLRRRMGVADEYFGRLVGRTAVECGGFRVGEPNAFTFAVAIGLPVHIDRLGSRLAPSLDLRLPL